MRIRCVYLSMIFRVLISFKIVFFICSCSREEFKLVHCFLSNVNLETNEKIFFLSQEKHDLYKSGFNVNFKSFSWLENKKCQNQSLLMIPKNELPVLKSHKGFNHLNYRYIAENENYLLYRYNKTFSSKYLGEVPLINYGDLQTPFKGGIKLVASNCEKTKTNGLKIPKGISFPINSNKSLSSLFKNGDSFETCFGIKPEVPMKLNYVNSIDSRNGLSIYYSKDEYKFSDTEKFKSFTCFRKIPTSLKKSDDTKSYLWNISKNAFEIRNFKMMVLHSYSGKAKFNRILKDYFVWSPNIKTSSWQKSEPSKGTNGFYFKLKKNKTGLHFHDILPRNQKDSDSLNIEFDLGQYNSKGVLFICFEFESIEQGFSKKEIKIDLSKYSSINNHVQKTIPLVNYRLGDRYAVYLRNESKSFIEIYKFQGAIVSKNITCN